MKLPRSHHLPEDEIAGQVLMPAINIGFINKNSTRGRQLVQMVRASHVVGFVILGGHPADVRHWTDYLQRESKYPLLFAGNLERASRRHFPSGTMFPHSMSFGATKNKQLVIDFAEVFAKEARAVGINVIFGPVLDLADYPANPIINIRSWHSDPDMVAEYGQLFIETVQNFGIACVGKHFPGHGSTAIDSHLGLPTLKKKMAQLEKADLIPFRKACDAGVKAIMPGHLKLEEYDNPATFESRLIKLLLREKWKYDGLVFTDALDMGAIINHYTFWEQAIYPIKAGADILLMPRNSKLCHQILQKEIRSNCDIRQQMEAAVDRIFRLKKWIHKHQPAQSHPYRIYKMVELPNHIKTSQAVAEESITLIHRSNRFPLNLPEIESVKHIIFSGTKTEDQPLGDFCRHLEHFFDTIEIWNNPLISKVQSIKSSRHSIIIISVYLQTYGGHAQKLDWKAVNKIVKILENSEQPVILVFFGNPFNIKNLVTDHGADAIFLTYSYVETTQHAAFKALCSFINIGGNLPVKMKQPFQESIQLSELTYRLQEEASGIEWKEIDKIVESAIKKRYFPGGVVLAAHRGKIVYHKAYGKFDYDKKSPEVKLDTLYDLASLTKVLATTPATMRLIGNGALNLDQCLSDFYPQLEKANKGGITIADLLIHQSGLPAWKPFYEKYQPANSCLEKRSSIIDQILDIPLEYKTGGKAVYSDLGFILLLDIIESLTDVPFDIFCRKEIFEPMGLTSLLFNPADEMKDQTPPTGRDKWRGTTIQGMVNDNNCFAIGGVSTHAGLFGNAEDVAAIGQMFIQKGIYNKRRHFRRKLIEAFSRPANPKISNRAFGWDMQDENGSSGKLFLKQSIGHLGFTGCSVWVDLKKEIIVVFLCNRVHPDPQKNRMDEFRPQLHDAIMRRLLK